MKDDIEVLVRFCRGEDRFFRLNYSPIVPARGWEVMVHLGTGYTCTAPHVVGNDRWLKVQDASLPEALDRAVKRLASVRPLVREEALGLPACPQAWHGGLPFGLLHECRYRAGHRGCHRNATGDLVWGGELSPAEQERAAELRNKEEEQG